MSELITADLHIDSNRDMEATIRVLTFIREEAIKNKVKRVVVLGDIYDKKHPNSEERMVFQKWVMGLIDSGLEVLLVVGNHDSFALKSVNRGEKHYSFGEFEILRIAKVKVVRSGYKEDEIFYGHFPVGEAVLSNNYDMSCFSKNVITTKELVEDNPDCKLFMLGDIHRGQMVLNSENKRVLYVGSPERVDWGERNDRKVILIRDNLKLSSIETPIRKWVQIEEDWTDNQHSNDSVDSSIDGAIVKLVIKIRKDTPFVIREDLIRERYVNAYKLIIKKDVVTTNRVRNKDINESKSPTNCFIEYANKLKFSKVTVTEGIKLIGGVKK